MRGLLASLVLLSIVSPLSAQTVRITGRVLEGREPFAGALVELYPAAQVYEDALRQLAGDPPIPLKSTRTGPDGSFELLAPESGAYRVMVRAKDRFALEHLVVPLVEEVFLVPAELMLPTTVTIQALGPEGRPLPGLPLRVAPPPVDDNPWRHAGWHPVERQGVTGPDGKLTLPRGKFEPLNVYVIDPGYLGQVASEVHEDSVTVRPESRPRTIEVLGAQGKPVAGALVRWGTWPVGVTGPQGRLSLTLPSDGASPLLVEGPGGERAEVKTGAEPAAGVLIVRIAPAEAVTGRIADSQTGKPIAGALVWSGLPPDLPPVRTTADGSFRLPVPTGGESWLGAAAPGYQIPERQSGRPAKPLTMTLTPAATLRGQVVDKAGAPIPGASVEIEPGPSRARSLSSIGFMPVVETRPDGSFSFHGLLPGGVYKLQARRSGYGRAEAAPVKMAPTGQASPPARIVLGSGTTVTGRVVDEAGNPVEGAAVEMIDAKFPLPDGSFRADSDVSGAFSIPHLIPGQFRFLARRAGFSATLGSEIMVPDGETRLDAGELVLKAGAAIEGRVTDTRGRPLEGVVIRGYSEQGPITAMVVADQDPAPDALTGSDGRFRIEDLERGRLYNLAAHHAAHPRAMVQGIQAPTDEPVHIELQTARSLSGRVVGPEGEPVPDAEVTAAAEVGFGMTTKLGRTGPQGEFRGTGLKPGLLDLQVTARGYRDTWWRGVQIPQDRDPEPVTITLERASVLEGRAQDEEGNPVPGARIIVVAQASPGGRPLRFPFEDPATDSGGRFRVDGLAPGEYTLSAWLPGSSRRAEATVRLGSGTTQVELVFKRGTVVAGRVVDEAGDPVPSAEVYLRPVVKGQRERTANSQADGSFRVQNVDDGHFELVASASGYARSASREIHVAGAGLEGLEIRLSREAAGTITGRVLGLPPETLSQVWVAADTDFYDEEGVSQVDEQGRYRLPGLRSGLWRVMASQPNGPAAEGEVELAPGAEAVLDLQFPEGNIFSGRVSLNGLPLRGAEISAASLQIRDYSAKTQADHEGRFSLGPLKPGPHSILIYSAEKVLALYRTIQLQEGQEVQLEVETAGVQGRILSAGGEPVPDAAIQFRVTEPSSGRSLPDWGPSVRSDAQGAFEVLSIPAGSYTLVVQKPGFQELQARMEVQPGAPTVQDIVLKAVE